MMVEIKYECCRTRSEPLFPNRGDSSSVEGRSGVMNIRLKIVLDGGECRALVRGDDGPIRAFVQIVRETLCGPLAVDPTSLKGITFVVNG